MSNSKKLRWGKLSTKALVMYLVATVVMVLVAINIPIFENPSVNRVVEGSGDLKKDKELAQAIDNKETRREARLSLKRIAERIAEKKAIEKKKQQIKQEVHEYCSLIQLKNEEENCHVSEYMDKKEYDWPQQVQDCVQRYATVERLCEVTEYQKALKAAGLK